MMKFLSKKLTPEFERPEFERNNPLDLSTSARTEGQAAVGGFAGDEDSFQAEAIAQVVEEAEPASSNSGPDDALGLYLKQMGSIPLLNKEKERALAQKLEEARNRYRHAVLCNWVIVRRVVDIFDLVRQGKLNLDPQIDVIASTGLTREHILARMPHNLRTLRKLLQASAKDYMTYLRTKSVKSQARQRRDLFRRLRKAVTLVAELSPRTELLDSLVLELTAWQEDVQQFQRQANRPGRAARDQEQRMKASKELRHRIIEAQTTPEELARLLEVIGKRRKSLSDCPQRTGRGESASGRGHRQALSWPGSVVRRSDSGRQSRPDAGRGQI